MDQIDCRDFTEHEGGERLRNPNSVTFSSRDPHRGLYPKVSRKNPGPAAMGSGFMTASEALNPKLPFVNSSQTQMQSKLPEEESTEEQTPSWWKPKRSKSKLPGQSNTLDKYCIKKAPSSTTSQSFLNSCSQSSQSSQSSSLSSSPSSSSSQTRTTLMYKPIRKMEDDANSIFYDGSPTKSFNKRLFDAQKVKPKTKKSKKPPPKFNRDNAFLYSQGPVSTNKSESLKTFGLLGNDDAIELSSDEEQEEICWFDYLPLEVMENILCRLPLLDLCLNVNAVCKRWNEIISNEKVRSLISFPVSFFHFLMYLQNHENRLLYSLKEFISCFINIQLVLLLQHVIIMHIDSLKLDNRMLYMIVCVDICSILYCIVLYCIVSQLENISTTVLGKVTVMVDRIPYQILKT